MNLESNETCLTLTKGYPDLIYRKKIDKISLRMF